MAILDILQYPDRRLRERARPVAVVDEAVCRLVDDMLATMYAAPGIGLAATQVGVGRRIAVIDVSEMRDSPMVLINPELTLGDEQQLSEEGCLSIPGVNERVRRAATVRLEALDRNGEPWSLETDGLLAACIQHEVDHLDGRLMIDYLSMLKRHRIDRRMAKERRRSADDRRAAG